MSDEVKAAVTPKPLTVVVIGWTEAGQLRVPRGYQTTREAIREGKKLAEACKLARVKTPDMGITRSIAGALKNPPTHSVDVEAVALRERKAAREDAKAAKAEAAHVLAEANASIGQ
jgi:hypothetical protein